MFSISDHQYNQHQKADQNTKRRLTLHLSHTYNHKSHTCLNKNKNIQTYMNLQLCINLSFLFWGSAQPVSNNEHFQNYVKHYLHFQNMISCYWMADRTLTRIPCAPARIQIHVQFICSSYKGEPNLQQAPESTNCWFHTTQLTFPFITLYLPREKTMPPALVC